MPMLAACPKWESAGGNADTTAGTDRHALYANRLLRAQLSPDSSPEAIAKHDAEAEAIKARLSEADIDGVEWAVAYTQTKAPSEHHMRIEYHVNPLDSEFYPLFENGGTLDVACGPVLFDLKWRERDYGAQMAAYALDIFQEFGFSEIEVHLLFAESKRAQVFKFTEAEAATLVNNIVAAVKSPDAKAAPCDYCAWCARQLTCPAKLERVNAVIAGRDDWKLEQYHVSKIETAEEMGKALRLARQIADWAESVEFYAREMLIKKGITPTGFESKSRQGNRFITSVTDAFSRLGIPQETFLAACEIKPSAAFEAYAAFNGLKKATAEKEAERKLGDVIQRKPSTVSLVATKE